MVKIAGGKSGSVSRLKKDMERSSGARTWIKNVRAEEDMTVRFLTEPDDWYAYREHYSPDVNFFPCIGKDNDCPGCHSDSEKIQRTSRRYLANALDVQAGVVVPLKLPLDLANRLVARYERNNDTIMNRDYTLHRMGKGLDTTYDVTPEDPSNVDVSRYELVDLEKALVQQFEDAFSLDTSTDSADTPDEEEVPSEPSASTEQGDDGGYLTEEQAMAMDKDELKTIAEQLGIEIDGRWSQERIVKTIFDTAG